VRRLDHAHSGALLLVGDLFVELAHFRPVHLRAEVVLGVVAVVEPDPIVEPVIAAHAPGDGQVGVAAVVAVVAVQVREAVAEIIKRQVEAEHEAPVQHEAGGEERDE
jgi:hypothetical protein